MTFRRRSFAFISGNRVWWGGSEELWSAAAAALAADGHRTTIYKSRIDEMQPRIQRLRELGCRIRDLGRFPAIPHWFFTLLARGSHSLAHLHEVARLWLGLTFSRRPDLVVISQGGNFDGLWLAGVCQRMGLPYVLISQKAADIYWPADQRRADVRAMFASALACFFVSAHNRVLTEEQIGVTLPGSAIIRNPFLVPWERTNHWPDERDGIRLACVGRLYPMEKGQDILLRVLARDRWRERPVSLTFFGDGAQRTGLEELAKRLRLTNVTFAGFVRDVPSIWRDHHALILPSRCEGLPLVVVEAMLSGRVPIATSVAASEVVEDSVTGFLASAPTENALDEAMERAWQRRSEWRAIGAEAADRIRTLVPPDPARVAADVLVDVAAGTAPEPAAEPLPLAASER